MLWECRLKFRFSNKEIFGLSEAGVLRLTPIGFLLLPCFLSATGLSVSFPYVSNALCLLVFTFIPGLYPSILLGQKIGLSPEEILVLDAIISMSGATIVCGFLSFALSFMDCLSISAGLLLLTLPSAFFYLSKRAITQKGLSLLAILRSIVVVFVFLYGFLVTVSVLPETYWRAWDVWFNTPITRLIVNNGKDPVSLLSLPLPDISGFWYFLASVRAFSGVDYYVLSRFGGPILSGLCCTIIFLISRRLEDWFPSVLAYVVLPLNYVYLIRFSMTIRENFAYVFLLGVLFLLTVRPRNNQRSLIYSLVLGFVLAATFASHAFVAFLAYGLVVIELSFFGSRASRASVSEIVFAIIFSVVLASPWILTYSTTLSYVLSRLSSNTTVSFIFGQMSVFSLFVTKAFRRRVKSHILLLALLPIAISLALYVAFVNGAIEQLSAPYYVLGLLGFLTIVKLPMPTGIISFLLLIISVLDFMILAPSLLASWRLVIPLIFLLTLGAARALRSSIDIIRGLHLSVNEGKLKVKVQRSATERSLDFKKGAIALLISVMLIMPNVVVLKETTERLAIWQPNFNEEDVRSANEFVSLLSEDDVVLTQQFTEKLLFYAGLDLSRIVPKDLRDQAYRATLIQEFYDAILPEYQGLSRIYVFLIRRYAGIARFASPPVLLLEAIGKRRYLGSIIYYEIQLTAPPANRSIEPD
jgi:hypothetical protein